MSIFRDLERTIDQKLRGPFQGQKREVIEIQRAILDEITDRAQMLPRARRVLPANEITIRIPSPEEDRRSAFRMVFIEGDALEHEITAHLRQEQIEFPDDLQIKVELSDESMPDLDAKGFHIVYRTRERETPTKREVMTVRFTLAQGDTVDVSKAQIHIGRTSEVLDDRRRLARRNDIAIDDQTVSRAHAHIEWDANTGGFRLFDDGSSYGTSVLQQGRLAEVPKAGGRGQKLESGDEIYFGQSRVRFDIL